MDFSEIIGNRNIVDLIAKGVRKGTLYPSLIFHGKEGIGKRSTAMMVAQGLNCASDEERPCGHCSACRNIQNHNHPDVRFITPEFYDDRLKNEERKSLNLKIDQIREIVENINFKPYAGKKKVFIIDHAETLTEEAGNALLKTLEEPPLHAVLILITSAYHSLLPTVRSRCWALPFNPVPPHLIEDFLIRTKGMDRKEAHALSILCEGSIGKAVREDLRSFIGRSERIMGILEDGIGGNIPAVIRDADDISRGQEELRRNLDMLSSVLRDGLVFAIAADPSLLINENLVEKLQRVPKTTSDEALQLLEKAESTKEILHLNINKKVAAEALLFEIARLCSRRKP